MQLARRGSRRLPPQWDRRTRELGKVLVGQERSPGFVRRQAMFAGLRRVSPLVVAPFGRAQLLVDTRDEMIGRTVFLTGGFERSRMERAFAVLASEGLKGPDRAFVDVGANIGTSTVDALVEFGMSRAWCFEPERHNFRLLKMNLLLNDLDSRTTAVRLALSDHDGVTQLALSGTNFGDHRVVVGGSGPEEPAAREVQTVPCRRLDAFVEGGAMTVEDVGLVWIDTQGYDPFVMEGAARFLHAGTPMVVEYWPDGLSETSSFELLESLVRRHYRKVVDLGRMATGARADVVLEAERLADLRARYGQDEYTDLLLLR